jgi:2-polyprenyl-3-methyl-5-hydroxy-6-metoxy-1,4-benzoquinol methylase
MSEQNAKSGLESPAPGQNIYDEAIFISGWLQPAERERASCLLRAYLDDSRVAETRLLFQRGGGSNGFRMLGKLASRTTESRAAVLRVTESWDDAAENEITRQSVRLVPALLRERPFGDVLFPENETLLHRENIYGSGPPIEEPGVEVMNLLRQYLTAKSSVVDVGCGAGAYGPGLMAEGHDWLGLEANPYCCEILERRQLPFRRVEPEIRELPGADGEWDNAICIEVLEHVKDPEVFLREIARMIRTRALFSVPNMEVIPYLYDWRVAPWHLLEADHKNFFTRASLSNVLSRFFRRVEVFPYGEHPLRSRDDVPLYVHLFAVADS